MEGIFDSAKVTASGQITLPKDIREALGVRTGDTIIFIRQGNQIAMMNSAVYAMKTLQTAMKGEAEKAGIYSDNDVTELVREMRAEVSNRDVDNL
jgi:AbrB family looped-hinge helix DNA binding protein